MPHSLKRFPPKHTALFVKLGAALCWLALWELGARLLKNSLLLPAPTAIVARLFTLSATAAFWQTVGNSFLAIAGGFFIASVLAVFLAVLSHKYKPVGVFVAPPMQFLKAVPVASFVLILFVLLPGEHRRWLSLLIAAMMVLPVQYTNLRQGLSGEDPALKEMARLYRIPWHKRLLYVHLSHLMPYALAGSKIALGLCWKSGVAAELIGVVSSTIGNEMYYARLYLDFTGVFAWTLVVVLLSILFEKGLLALGRLAQRRLEA
ncbi:MAG: ABC transporter permease subunit [Clostridiales bacterium]|jgi:NitT/TauT family transport system permease protein|nr:ABC transporter permease subunit [Clostridiales bacterium]